MKKLIKNSLLLSLGTVVYVAGVAWFMNNAEKFFGNMKSIGGPIAFLLLFVLSAGVTGSLVLGQPIMLYAEGKKKEAVKQLALTLGWLFIMLVLIFISVWFRK